MNQVLIIPGMDDRERPLAYLTRNWPERFNLQPTVMAFGWGMPPQEYEERQDQMLQKVEQLASLGSLSVIGLSAGGHKAINLLAERPNLVRSVVNISGFSCMGSWEGGSERHAMLRHSLDILAAQEFDPGKVMTIRPSIDKLVPADTVPVDGATNLRLWTPGHILGSFWALGGRARTITEFIANHQAGTNAAT